MNVVTVCVSSIDQINKRMKDAFSGKPQGIFVSFATIELLWKTLPPRRWELLQALVGQGAISLRGAARLIDRDVKTVHGDMHALLNAGLLERTDDGLFVFPYDAVHVDFMIEAPFIPPKPDVTMHEGVRRL